MLFFGWRREDRETEVAYDKRADAGEDDDYEAYNEMLAQMNTDRER